MTGSVEMATNPYVGPRAFEEDEHELFYGREEEIAILEGLVMSRRAVLFFAQSGAGKSSLLKAGLAPELTRQETIGRSRYAHTYQKMRVLPVLSVGGAIPANLGARVENVFVFSALFSLHPNSDPAEIAGLSFTEGLAPYFQEREEEGEAGNSPSQGDSNTLLIFDQFEELFTHHLERWQEREDFFHQVNQTLEAYPNLHVLFSMREDHIAELTPYAHLLPEQLRPRFRMERLKRESALQAVTEPAKKAKRSFGEGVAEALVDNLRRTQPGRERARQEDGEPAEQTSLGEYVEPVHLQLVCRQLWQKLPPERSVIEAGDVQDFGDVDKALTDFYEATLSTVLSKTSLSERGLRTWFDRKLITPARTRGLVYRDETETEGLANSAVDILNEAYIIRASTRGRDIWYELAHDRLVEPILASNRAWLANYHNPLTVARRAWMEAGEDPNKLLRGDSLTAAEEYAAKNPADILPEEKEFLAKSRRMQEERSAGRRRILAGIAMVAIVILGGLTAWALVERNRANVKATEASGNAATATANLATARVAQGTAAAAQGTAEAGGTLAAMSEGVAKNKAAEATISLATAVYARRTAGAALGTAEADRSRADQLAKIADSRRLAAQAQGYLGENARLALLLSAEAIRIWDTAEARSALLSGIQQKLERVLSQAAPVLPLQNYGGAKAVAFSPDGGQVAIGTRQGPVLMWRPGDEEGVSTLRGHNWEVLSAGFSPDNKILATGDYKSNIILWDTATGQQIGQFTANDWVLSLEFNPKDQNILASGGSGLNKRVFLWDISDPQNPVKKYSLNDPKDDVRMVKWSPNGELIAGGGEIGDRTVWVWDVKTGQALRQMPGHPAAIWSVAWSPDGRRLASGDQDGNIYIWDYASGTRENNFNANRTEVLGLTFSPDGNTLAAVNGSGIVSIWDVTRKDQNQEPLQVIRLSQSISADFSPGSDQLVLGSSGEGASIWNLTLQQPLREPIDATVQGMVQSIRFLDESNFRITANTGNRVNLWQGDGVQLKFISGRSGIYPSSAIFPDGGQYALGRENGAVEIIESDSGQMARSFEYFSEPLLSMAVSPKANLLAFGVKSGEIMLWNLPANQKASPFTLPGSSQAALSLAFSLDGKYLASGYQDGSIILWELTGDSIQGSLPLPGSRAGISTLAFSPDGKILASGSPDKTIQLWDVESRQSIGGPLSGSIGAVTGLAFNQDGTVLIAGDADGNLARWDTDLDSWRGRACELAGGKLEMKEWNQFFPNNEEYAPACP